MQLTGKLTGTILTLLFVTSIACECSAQRPDGPPRFGQGEGEGKRFGQGRGRPGDQGQRRPGFGDGFDPAQMVSRFIQEFDTDGDQKLDAKELTKLFNAMRERRARMGRGPEGRGPEGRGPEGRGPEGRGPGAGQQGPGQDNGFRFRGGGDGPRFGGGDGPGKAGGDLPKRPPAE